MVHLPKDPRASFGRAATATVAIAVPPSIAPSIAPTAKPASWTTGRGLGASFVYLQIAAADFLSVETRNGLGCLGIVRHFDKSESASPSSLPVHRDMNARDLSERLEQRAQIRLGRLKTHVAGK